MALTKVNSVGIATGISLTGITTTQDAKIGTGITLSPDGDGYYTGIVTATSYRGDVSNCTGVGQTNFIDAESLNVSGISTLNSTKVGTGITLSPDGDVYVTGVTTVTTLKAATGTVTGDLDVADKIVHTGDTDTSVRFTGANTIALQTGGTQRLVADSSGFVGIGSVSPVDTAGAGHCLDIQGASATAIYLRNTNRDTGQIDFAASTMTIRTRQATPILFNVNNSERARIDTGGRLLLGNSASAGKSSLLQVTASGGDTADFSRYVASEYGPNLHFIKSRNATAGSHTIIQSGDHLGIINFRGSDGSAFRAAAEIGGYVDGTPGSSDMPGRLVFSTTSDGASGPTERLRIDSAGAVILSNTFNSNTDISPALCVGSASFGRPGIVIRGNATNKGDISFCDNSGTDSSDGVSEGLIRYDHDGDYMCFHTADAETVRITSAGNVGINDASPSNQLIVKAPGGSGHSCAKIVSGDGNQLLTMQVIQGAEARLGTDSGAPLALYSNGNEFARLQTTGQLTFGTTTDVAPDGFASKIQVNASNHEGSIQVGRHTANANGPSFLFLKTRSGSSTPGTGVVSSGDSLGVIRWYASDGTDTASSAAQIQCTIDETPGTNDMPGRLTFFTTPNSESSSQECMRLDCAGTLSVNGGHSSTAQMDSYASGYESMPKFFQSDGTVSNKSGDAWTTVLNVGTSEATWDLCSFKGSTNFGIWCEVTCYFSQITAGKAGRQRISFRMMRVGNNNFGTSVGGPYDKVGTDTDDHFTPSITTTGSGSGMRAKFRVTTTSLTNYCQTMYHIRWLCGDYGTEPIMIV